MTQTSQGRFITFEGPEGSGKSTQIALLAQALEERGLRVLATREPGGTAIGNRIREIVLDKAHTEMSPRAEALLYSAARAQIVDEVIRPALKAGAHVLCDRYVDSTIAYQGYGHGRTIDELQRLGDFATDGLIPDLTIFLDLNPEIGLLRKQSGAAAEWNRFEQRDLDYHMAVYQGYQQLIHYDPQRWHVVDAAQETAAIHQRILERVLALVGIS